MHNLTGVNSRTEPTHRTKTEVHLREDELQALHEIAKRTDRSVAEPVRSKVVRQQNSPATGGEEMRRAMILMTLLLGLSPGAGASADINTESLLVVSVDVAALAAGVYENVESTEAELRFDVTGVK